MMLLAIDPGNEQSAFVLMEGDKIVSKEKLDNYELLTLIRTSIYVYEMAIEAIASYGMPVGKEVFDTCIWTGRFIQAHKEAHGLKAEHTLVYRKDVKIHFCHSMKAKDSNIRQALIDRFGGKDKAIGKKNAPGPLYGVSKDMWQALAVGLFWMDTQGDGKFTSIGGNFTSSKVSE